MLQTCVLATQTMDNVTLETECGCFSRENANELEMYTAKHLGGYQKKLLAM